MVPDIDFLPLSYKHDRQRYQKRIWRRVVLIVFLALIVAGTFQQRRIQARLQVRSTLLKSEAARMMSQLEDPAAARAKIHDLDVRAQLATRLRLCVSPTRLLHAVANSLPQYVSLTRCELVQTPVAKPATARAKPQTPDTQEPETKSPVERDLKQLTEEAERTVPSISLEGIAPDDMAVSAYLAALQNTQLFDEIHLLYSDTVRYGEYALRGFQLQLRVRQPGKTMPVERPGPIATGSPTRNRESG